MHKAFEILLLTMYFAPAAVLVLFSINLYYTLAIFLRSYRAGRSEIEGIRAEFKARFAEADLPSVVTQIPIFNEYNVAERIIRASAEMDYPAGRHLVQVLDDSTDETQHLVDRVAADLRAGGRNVQVIRREKRTGFKAGALQNGMELSDAQYFAIFDADFVPPKDFLLRTMEVMMVRPRVGIVQARWGHLNDKQSFVTRAQGIGIDGHFGIEQPARAWNELFMNFNGTAGLWRRTAIEAAGGWEHDTLTEDMDLSYRAQLAGWKPFFLFDLVVPAELPDNINAFKAQQFRWAKGSTQTAIKLLPRVFASNVPLGTKIHAALHMTHYFIHPLMVCVAFVTLPVLEFTRVRCSPFAFAVLFTVFIVSTLAPVTMYIVSQAILYERGWRRLRFLPFLTSLGVGIAISNSRAVLEAVFGKQSAFIRTPKKGDQTARAYAVRLSYLTIAELLLGLYCFATFFIVLASHRYLVVPFLFLYAWGFTGVGLLSMYHFFQESRWAKMSEFKATAA